jgi:hypothetical protein
VLFQDGRAHAVHDWDSVVSEPEVVIAGQAAAMWSVGRHGHGASVGEASAFLAAYQDARGLRFTADEVGLCWAAGLWVRAFNAKKFHLDGVDALARDEADAWSHLAGI